MPETSEDRLLGGRLTYRQLRHGYRSGIEPVLLAAAVPAQPGQRVLEAGCGAGAATLCLAARVAGLCLVGIEAEPSAADLARHNWAANGLADAMLHPACLPDTLPDARRDIASDLRRALGRFDHVFANPPWHAERGTASPSASRDLARRAPAALLLAWVEVLGGLLREGGSLTLILPAGLHAQAAAAMQEGCGGIRLLPLWPRAGRAAKIVLLQGRRGSKSPGSVLPGLVLHEADGRFTAAAERVLRDGEALELA